MPVFHGQSYTRMCDSGMQCFREQTLYSMEPAQRTMSELATSPPTVRMGLPEYPRQFMGPHALAGIPTMMDHWPTPPMAHNQHITNNNNNNSSSSNTDGSSSGSGNNGLRQCLQSQCVGSDGEASAVRENNNNNNNNNNGPVIMKNGMDSPVNDLVKSDVIGQSGDGHSQQNTVGTVVLHGITIVSLIIDNKERLCLAQISNTLLKDYSYNEIHNRRVALGITCVQCTPVQLEILRRAGAMPVSSRRCGMITKREAERLVKSFLEDNAPPKLPEDFAFDVLHHCGWGCRGLFEPARYNSSRAKCIKCIYCSMYFSPNKFIFHFHRTPGAKYNHPDAANFNSWRRHLKLTPSQEKEDITFKWEDVKAMFNGGTRKRIGSSVSSSSSSPSSSHSPSAVSSSKYSSSLTSPHHQHHSNHNHPQQQTSANGRVAPYQHHPAPSLDGPSSAKKAKTASMMDANSYAAKPNSFPSPFNPYGWLASPPNKSMPYPFMAMNSAQSMCFGFPPQITAGKDALVERIKSAPVGVGNPAGWMNRNPVLPFQLASMDLLWDKTFGFPSAAAMAAFGNFRNGSYHNSMFPAAPNPMAMELGERLSPPGETTPCISPNSGMHSKMMSPGCHDRGEKGSNRMSAFTRVVPSLSPPSSASLSPQHSQGDHNSPSRHDDEEEDEDEDDGDNDNTANDNNFSLDTSRGHDTECSNRCENRTENTSLPGCDVSCHRDVEDSEEIDVENHPDDKKTRTKTCSNSPPDEEEPRETSPTREIPTPGQKQSGVGQQQARCDVQAPSPRVPDRSLEFRASPVPGNVESHATSPTVTDTRIPETSLYSDRQRVEHRTSSPEEVKQETDTAADNEREAGEVTRRIPETQTQEMNNSDSFQQQMSRHYEMLRETLNKELQQERMIRLSLEEKLKQAHEALVRGGLPPRTVDATHFNELEAQPRS